MRRAISIALLTMALALASVAVAGPAVAQDACQPPSGPADPPAVETVSEVMSEHVITIPPEASIGKSCDDVCRRLVQQPEQRLALGQPFLRPDRLGHILEHTDQGNGPSLVVLLRSRLGDDKALFEIRGPEAQVEVIALAGLHGPRHGVCQHRRIFGMMAMGYMVFLLINIGASLFGFGNVYASGGILAILICLFGVGMASYSLAIDFDSIDRAVGAGAPEKYSWLLGHGLVASLVWLYIEFLRLFAVLQND